MAWALFALAPCLHGESIVEAVAAVESRGNASAIGDRGAARGAWQLHRAAWADVSKARAQAGRPVYEWATSAHDPRIGREYAAEYLRSLGARLARALGRKASEAEVYAAYNLGFAGFARRHFTLARCPIITQRAAAQVTLRCRA